MRQEALEVSNPASQVTARLFFLHFFPVSFHRMKCQAKILSRKMFLYQWFKCPHWHVSLKLILHFWCLWKCQFTLYRTIAFGVDTKSCGPVYFWTCIAWKRHSFAYKISQQNDPIACYSLVYICSINSLIIRHGLRHDKLIFWELINWLLTENFKIFSAHWHSSARFLVHWPDYSR